MTAFNLRDRIFSFVLQVINLVKSLPQNYTNKVIVDQILRSVTSIGANYEEADGTRSKKDFLHKMGIVKKETKETAYWLKLLKATNTYIKTQIEVLEKENEELVKIVSKIILNSQSK